MPTGFHNRSTILSSFLYQALWGPLQVQQAFPVQHGAHVPSWVPQGSIGPSGDSTSQSAALRPRTMQWWGTTYEVEKSWRFPAPRHQTLGSRSSVPREGQGRGSFARCHRMPSPTPKPHFQGPQHRKPLHALLLWKGKMPHACLEKGISVLGWVPTGGTPFQAPPLLTLASRNASIPCKAGETHMDPTASPASHLLMHGAPPSAQPT